MPDLAPIPGRQQTKIQLAFAIGLKAEKLYRVFADMRIDAKLDIERPRPIRRMLTAVSTPRTRRRDIEYDGICLFLKKLPDR